MPQRLFHNSFAEFSARYEIDYAPRLGRFRRERISTAVEPFLDCGDYTKGIASICGHGTQWHSVLQSLARR